MEFTGQWLPLLDVSGLELGLFFIGLNFKKRETKV
jgi:hypothetical protein